MKSFVKAPDGKLVEVVELDDFEVDGETFIIVEAVEGTPFLVGYNQPRKSSFTSVPEDEIIDCPETISAVKMMDEWVRVDLVSDFKSGEMDFTVIHGEFCPGIHFITAVPKSEVMTIDVTDDLAKIIRNE